MAASTVEFVEATQADEEWMENNLRGKALLPLGMDPASFGQRFNAQGFAVWQRDDDTVVLSRLPDGRIHVYVDPAQPGPFCFTLNVSA